MRKWTDDKLNKLRQLLEVEKRSTKEVSKIFNISRTLLYHLCHKYDIKITFHPAYNAWTEDEISIVRVLLERGKTYEEISHHLEGRSKASIMRLFEEFKDKYNLKRPDNWVTPQLYISISTDTKQKVKDLLMKGYKQDEIEEITGVRPPNFSRIIKELNIIRPSSDELQDMGVFYIMVNKKLTRVDTDLTPDRLKELLESGKTKLEISKDYGISEGVIGRYAKRHGFTDEKLDAAKEVKRELIRKLEGKEATDKDLNRSFDDILTKDFVEDLLKKNMYCIGGCGAELGISPVYITHAVRKFNIDVPEELREDIFWFGLKKYNSSSSFVASSMGEYFTEGALKNLGLSFKRQISLKGIVPEDIRLQRVSIDYILTYNGKEIWIEYNGTQHYKYIERLHKDKKDIFIRQVKRDMWVKKYCKENNITYIEIPYTFYSVPEIQDLLQRVIIKGEDINNIIDYAPFYKEIRELGISIDEN